MASEGLHEPREELASSTVDMHRAIASLMEELEAVDWYAQRIDATDDEALKAILAHNRDEEKEHACMVLEWIRRRDTAFDEYLRRFLFTEGPIVGREHAEEEAREQEGRGVSDGSLAFADWRRVRRVESREASDERERRTA